MLYYATTADCREGAGWTQETVGPGSGHYCLLLNPPTLSYTAHLCTLLTHSQCSLMHTALLHFCTLHFCTLLSAHKVATSNPLLLFLLLLFSTLCTLLKALLPRSTSKYFYDVTNLLPLSLTSHHPSALTLKLKQQLALPFPPHTGKNKATIE